jgi:hypothetical protein
LTLVVRVFVVEKQSPGRAASFAPDFFVACRLNFDFVATAASRVLGFRATDTDPENLVRARRNSPPDVEACE